MKEALINEQEDAAGGRQISAWRDTKENLSVALWAPEEDVLLSASLSSSSVSTSSSPDASESELALEPDAEATSKSEA